MHTMLSEGVFFLFKHMRHCLSIFCVLSSAPSGSNVSASALASVRNDVMNLVINATVAEQLAQRQLDALSATVKLIL